MIIRVLLVLMLCVWASGCAKSADSVNAANSNESQDRAEGGSKRLERKALRTVREHLQNQNPSVTDVTRDYFYTNPQLPDKAYISVTVNYAANAAANTNEKTRREFLAFVLVRDGDDWKVTDGSNAPHTVDPQKADQYLMGAR